MHSESFKKEAVRQVVEFSYPAHLVSKRLKIPYRLLMQWLEDSGHDVPEIHRESDQSVHLENAQLKIELAKIKSDMDVLKKLLKALEKENSSGKKQNVA